MRHTIRMYNLILLILLSYSCSFGKTIVNQEGSKTITNQKEEVLKYWKELLNYMDKGDVELVSNMMTSAGFASILKGTSPERYKEALKNFSMVVKNEPLQVVINGSKEAQLIIGKEDPEAALYSSVIILKYINGNWKLNEYYPAK